MKGRTLATSAGKPSEDKTISETTGSVKNGTTFYIFFIRIFGCAGTSTARRNHLNVPSVVKVSASRGLSQFTRSFTWRSRPTNVRCAIALSISAPTSRPTFSPTRNGPWSVQCVLNFLPLTMISRRTS
jgi:hypothetical protein